MLLRAESVHVHYGRHHALDGISFDVAAGEVVAILGPNGAGKTTTAKAISGLVKVSAGRVTFAGADVSNRSTDTIVKSGLALVPEGRRVFTKLTVLENLLVGGYTVQGNLSEDVERAFGYFPILKEKAAQRAGQLSGGQQQMLAIARALMSRPTLLILDEPTMGLAPIVVDSLADCLLALNRDAALSVLLIDQRLSLVERIASRAYVMRNGAIQASFQLGELGRNELERLYLGGVAAVGEAPAP